MKPIIEGITTVAELTKTDFQRNFFDLNRPVMIKGGGKNSNAFKKWSPEYLKSVIGKKAVDVKHSKNGVYSYRQGAVTNLNLSFDEAVTYMNSNNSVYIQQASIVDHYPELIADLDEPPWIEKTDISRITNFWYGGAGCVSPLHYDKSHNFFYQIMGRKELILFSPSDGKFLYPDTQPNFIHISLINLDNPDIIAYPLFKNAQGYRVIVNPGDVLYLPLHWWHQVRSLDLSISVNYWWHRFEFVDGLGFELASVQEIKSLIRIFLDNGLDIDQKNPEGETNLLKACDRGYINIVKAFLELGANPNIKSNKYEGCTPVSLASQKGHTEIVKLLSGTGTN
jgi:hypothetical protein